jgi:predicted nucleic acid-binding protein
MTSGAPERAIIDTSVYVENLRHGRFEAQLLKLPFLVRVSAVVVAELARGARSRPAQRFVERLARTFPVVPPSSRDWVRSGRVVRMLAERHDFEIHKIREMHFDVLIALTAQGMGAHLITCNAADFQAIREHLAFKLTCW